MLRAMYDDDIGSSSGPKMQLDAEALTVIERLGKWLRITGTSQLALFSLFLVMVLLTMGCGVLAGPRGMGIAMLAMLIPFAVVAVALLQGLRTLTAGEQFKNLAQEADADYLELAFSRLKTVFVIDLVLGLLMLSNAVLGVLK